MRPAQAIIVALLILSWNAAGVVQGVPAASEPRGDLGPAPRLATALRTSSASGALLDGIEAGVSPAARGHSSPAATAEGTQPSATGKPAGAGAAPPARPVAVRPSGAPVRPASRAPRSTAPQTGPGAAKPAPPALAPEQLESLIGVAEDISPEWAEWLRTRRESDPEALRAAIQSQGRRLIALAVLREHSPDLYELKVSELRLQNEVGDLAKRYRDAVDAGRNDEAAKLQKELRAKSAQQVDKSLKSRAAELAELDQQVRQLQKQLLEDTLNREARIEELLKSVTQPGGGGDPLPKLPGAADDETRKDAAQAPPK